MDPEAITANKNRKFMNKKIGEHTFGEIIAGGAGSDEDMEKVKKAARAWVISKRAGDPIFAAMVAAGGINVGVKPTSAERNPPPPGFKTQ